MGLPPPTSITSRLSAHLPINPFRHGYAAPKRRALVAAQFPARRVRINQLYLLKLKSLQNLLPIESFLRLAAVLVGATAKPKPTQATQRPEKYPADRLPGPPSRASTCDTMPGASRPGHSRSLVRAEDADIRALLPSHARRPPISIHPSAGMERAHADRCAHDMHAS